MNRSSRLVATSLALVCLLSATRALAVSTTFTINTALSSESVTILSGGTPISTAQFPGSNTTSLFGTMSVDTSGGNVQLISTNDTNLNLQALPVAPAPGGGAPFPAVGSGPGDIGLNLYAPVSFAAIRGAIGDETSGAIPLVGNAFDASQVTLLQFTGTLDYNLSGLGGSFATLIGTTSIAGGSALNTATGGTLTTVGNLETLTIPLLVDIPIHVPVGGGSGFITLDNIVTGTIVATALVPEPSSLMLAALGIPVALVARRKLRKNA